MLLETVPVQMEDDSNLNVPSSFRVGPDVATACAAFVSTTTTVRGSILHLLVFNPTADPSLTNVTVVRVVRLNYNDSQYFLYIYIYPNLNLLQHYMAIIECQHLHFFHSFVSRKGTSNICFMQNRSMELRVNRISVSMKTTSNLYFIAFSAILC